jgi:hypothetical protein
MKFIKKIMLIVLAVTFVFSACVSKKEYLEMQETKDKKLATVNEQLGKNGVQINKLMAE